MSRDAPEAWARLLEAAGGRAALARALEVSETTIYRWRRSEEPLPAVARIAINATCDRYGVSRIFGGDA